MFVTANRQAGTSIKVYYKVLSQFDADTFEDRPWQDMKEITNSNELKDLLVQQIESRVRWRESVLLMIDKGINQFIEIGPGKVLSGLIKRIDRNVKVSAINSEEDIKLININE